VLISVVIPTYNRPERLAACLDCLARQSLGREEFEVIVVDDGGDADLAPVVDRVREAVEIRLVRQPNTGPAEARNAGVALARGEFIAFTDDDCGPDGDWLRVLVGHLQREPKTMHGGRTVNGLTLNGYAEASQLLVDYLLEYNARKAPTKRFFTTNNMAMSKAAFFEVGAFNAQFRGAYGEDREFCDRWSHTGYEMRFVAEARVFHFHEMDGREFWRQHFNYGQGAHTYWKCRVHRRGEPMKVESLGFYLGMLAYPWKKGISEPARAAALLVVSQMANAFGFLAARATK